MSMSVPNPFNSNETFSPLMNSPSFFELRSDLVGTCVGSKNRLRGRMYQKQPQYAGAEFLSKHGHALQALQRRWHECDQSGDVLLWFVSSFPYSTITATSNLSNPHYIISSRASLFLNIDINTPHRLIIRPRPPLRSLVFRIRNRQC